jgi:hypothetical protein
MASNKLVMLANKAAKLHAYAADANRKWVGQFTTEYGHSDISDSLVEVIDYSTGDSFKITGDFIDENSSPGKS